MKAKKKITLLLLCVCFLVSCSHPSSSHDPVSAEPTEPVHHETTDDSVVAAALKESTLPIQKEVLGIDVSEEIANGAYLLGIDGSATFWGVATNPGQEYYVMEQGEKEVLYHSNASAQFCTLPYKDSLILGELIYEEDSKVEIRRISRDSVEVIYQYDGYTIPEISILDDFLLINYEESGSGENGEVCVKQRMVLLSLLDGTITECSQFSYVFDELGTCTGDLVQTANGFSGGFVYEVISFEDENMYLDETGNIALYYYDLDSGKVSELPITPQRKAEYAAGNTQVVITSDYAYAYPLDEVVTIYTSTSDGYRAFKLPDVGSTNYIMDAVPINDHIIAVTTIKNLFLIDTEKSVYQAFERFGNVLRIGNQIVEINNGQLELWNMEP